MMRTAEPKSQAESTHSRSSNLKGETFFPFNQTRANSFFGPAAIQPKLKIGEPGDKYEKQADRVADAVMRMPDPQVQRQSMEEEEELQMKREPDLQRMCKECEEDEKLQKKSESNTQPANHASSEISSELLSRSGRGSRLPDGVQSEMGNKIGANFREVNIHTDSKSHQLNQQLGARAFTHGRDIYFNRGEYNPASSDGKHLLAHELTHVVQQNHGDATIIQRTPLTMSERETLVDEIADEMATAHSEYNDGAQNAANAIAAAQRADAETAKTIFAMGMALIVPGFGGVVAGGFARFGVTVSRDLATNIGNAIGELAKKAGNSEIESTLQSDPSDFFISIAEGWEEAARVERRHLRSNIRNRSLVSDNTLRELHSYWLALARKNQNIWSAWFQEQWTRFEQQVGAIGPQGTGIVPHGPTPLSNDNIPVRIRMENGSTRLALVNKTRVDFTWPIERLFGGSDIRTRFRFLRWIDDDLADLAIAQVSSVPTIFAGHITGVS